MTKEEANRILDRVRDGSAVSVQVVSEALRVTGDVRRWIAKDYGDAVRVRFYSSTEHAGCEKI